jgi:hypothetical protein
VDFYNPAPRKFGANLHSKRKSSFEENPPKKKTKSIKTKTFIIPVSAE